MSFLKAALRALKKDRKTERDFRVYITRVGRPSAGHREGVCLGQPSAGRILVNFGPSRSILGHKGSNWGHNGSIWIQYGTNQQSAS